MKRTLAFGCITVLAAAVQAHFVFIVPGKDLSATIVFSDTLEVDDAVTVEKIAGLKLRARDGTGKDAELECKTGKHELSAKLPAGTQLVYGSVQYGLFTRNEVSYVLLYHPKFVAAGADPKLVKLADVPAELVAETRDGKTRFQLLALGKPAPDVEVTVMLPDQSKAKVKTDKDGYTPAYDAKGRYGLWARTTEMKTGELEGKKYSELRHYATLVIDLP